MYKYCSSKESLYQYIVACTVQELIQHINQFNLDNNDESLLQRVMRYTEYEFEFYSKNKNYYLLHQRIFIQSNEEIDLELREKYHDQAINIFQQIMNSGKEKLKPDVLKVYQWVLTAMKTECYNDMKEVDDTEKIKDEFKVELKKIFDILKQIS